MRIVAKRTLRMFWERGSAYADSELPLRAWYAEAKSAKWATPADVKAKYRSASVLKGGRVVFNIAGNKYRLVVHVRYDLQTMFVRFVGTHAEYDQVDAENV